MTDGRNERTANAADNASTDRREFIKGAAAAGLIGAVGLASNLAQPAAAAPQAEVEDPPAPPGLKPGAEPDCRFPLFYETSVAEGMRLVMQYFAALSRRDLAGMAKTMQYPFLTYEGTDPVIVQSVDELMSSPPPSMNVTGKGDHLIHPGAYDVMENVEALLYHPVGAGFSMNFSRYRSDGHKILVCNALFGVTNNDGHWGIEYMSTIFQPADLAYETFDADAVLNAMNLTQRDHALARKERDVIGLRETTMFPIPSASVWLGGSTANAEPARAGHPMAAYRVKGVKTRIRMSKPPTPEEIIHPSAQELAAGEQGMQRFLEASGGPVGKWGYSLEFAGPQGKGNRVLFAGTDKGHMFQGFSRFTADGTFISETRYIGAVCYKKKIWAASDVVGIFVQVMYLDHGNDVLL